MVGKMLLTIFTPTYNRKHTLHRLYASLLSQRHNYEWLVIDDGSTDGTEELITELVNKHEIPVRFIRKEHGGKHTAFNLAMQEAKGDFLLCLDSDDRLADGVVDCIFKAIPNLLPTDIGFIGYKAILNKEVLTHQGDSHHKGLYQFYRSSGNSGEFSLIFRTYLLRKYPFPEPTGEPYVSECVIFDRMEMDGYTFCPLHKVIEFCEYQQDGLSNNSFDYMMRSPTAFAIYHSQRINLVQTFTERLGHCIRFHAFSCILWRRTAAGAVTNGRRAV